VKCSIQLATVPSRTSAHDHSYCFRNTSLPRSTHSWKDAYLLAFPSATFNFMLLQPDKVNTLGATTGSQAADGSTSVTAALAIETGASAQARSLAEEAESKAAMC
jgi:hypothetical protein